MTRQGPTIYLETDDSGEIEIVLVNHAGEEQRIPRTTPEQDLVRAVELDYSAYRNEVHRLREKHPLFEEKPEVSSADYSDLTAQVTRIAETMRELDPIAYFAITARLDLIRRAPDDGSAQYLLSNGSQQIYALEEPLRAQVRLRNIFDVTFDGMERATQRERYEKLRATYPGAVNRFYHVRWMEETDGAPLSRRRMEYAVITLEELRSLELTLYFQQDKRRIARCEYCWSYFVPKTSHATAYCDRVFDGKTCNPGLAAWMFELSWDAGALSLDTGEGIARVGEAFASGTFLTRQKNKSSVVVSWYNVRDVSTDGELFSIRLKPTASSNGTYPVTLSCSSENTINAAEKEVPIACVSGSVTVIGTQHNGASGGASSSGSAASTEIVEAAQEPAQTKTEFVDVPKTAFYYDAVQWAVAGGITNGVGGDRFEPDGVCSRAQAVTFLWRAAGSPEPVVLSNPFSDVAAGSYYYKAVLWAVAEGITNGTRADTFSPNATVDRAQTVTFLWRANGSKKGTGDHPFEDVSVDSYYGNAVQWAVERKITSGTGANTFSPSASCTRAQIVTFLYREKTGGESK